MENDDLYKYFEKIRVTVKQRLKYNWSVLLSIFDTKKNGRKPIA